MTRRRNAFTLVEMMVTTLIAVVLLFAAFGGLTFIGSGFRRDELTMARHRVTSHVFELLADDVAHASGLADPGQHLVASGYLGTAETFLRETRVGEHAITSYAEDSASTRGLERGRYEEQALPAGDAWIVDVRASRWRTRPGIKTVNPWGITGAVLVIPLPLVEPDVTYVAISKAKNGELEHVLWAFWHRRREIAKKGVRRVYDPGTIERFGREFYRFDVPGKGITPARLMATIALRNEFVHEVGPDDLRLQPVETRLELELKEPQERFLPFASPAFLARRTFTAGL